MAKPFLLTTSWDDGSIHDLKLAEMLAKYELPATFYVARNSGFRGLSDNDIKTVGRSFELGSHTVNHVLLNSLADDAALAEIADSKTWTEQLSGRACRMFCFPSGKFRRSQLRFVEKAGLGRPHYRAYVSGFPEPESWRHGGAHDRAGVPSSSLGVSAEYRTPARHPEYLELRFIWPRQELGHNGKALLRHVSIHGGVFHLWGHSWEVEANDSWPELRLCCARWLHIGTRLRTSPMGKSRN